MGASCQAVRTPLSPLAGNKHSTPSVTSSSSSGFLGGTPLPRVPGPAPRPQKQAIQSVLDSSPAASHCPFQATSVASTPELRPTPSYEQSRASELAIPGPHPLDLVANLADLSYIARFGIEEAAVYYSNKYGPLCRFSNGLTAWTFVNDPAAIHHICVTNAKNYSRRYLPGIYEYVTHGKGILGSQGEYNKQHRKMCQPPFKSTAQLKKFTQIIADKAAAVTATWREQAGGGPLVGDVGTHMQRLTLDIIGGVAFSKDFGQIARIRDDPQGLAPREDMAQDRLLGAVNASQALMGKVFITPLPLLSLLRRLGEPGMRKMDRAFLEMRTIMTKVIQERRGQLEATGHGGADLLGVLLSARDDSGRPLTDEELWEDVHDIMGAGHETTASTITTCIYSISQVPGVEEKVVAELERVLGGRPPSAEDLPALRYLGQVVKEALRVYPAIPLFPRVVDQDDVLPSGQRIPGGDVVFMSTYAMGRNARVWDDPQLFNPDRFSPEAEAERHKFAWVPFGAGPRMCLGANFALMSVTQVVASLLQAFHFRAIKPTGPSLPFAYDITINFPGGIVMEIIPRK